MMSIQFNSTMKTEGVNLTHINSTVFDMFIEPALDRNMADDFNQSALDLTWKVQEFKDDRVQPQVPGQIRFRAQGRAAANQWRVHATPRHQVQPADQVGPGGCRSALRGPVHFVSIFEA